MITELRIKDFAIIDTLDLHFDTGLIIFTGETGAGKSIMIDAVEMLLGGRADTTMVRTDAERADIEGVFRMNGKSRAEIHAILEREELLDDPDFLTLGREIRINGRNVARINGRSVSVGLMRELGELLVDVHGQSEHLSLLRVSQHLRLLDSYANVEDLLIEYQNTYHQLQSVRQELNTLRIAERDAARQVDTLNYQINEIETAHLKPDEEGELREERNRLANAEGLANAAQEALIAIDEGTPESPAATDLLGQAVDLLGDLIRLDPSQDQLHGQLDSVFTNLGEIAHELRDYMEAIEFNPRRLDQVEERLNLIQNLKRKYGATIEAVLQYAEKARVRRDQITHAGERILELENQEANLLRTLGKQGSNLSFRRREQSAQLSSAIEVELNDLHMSRARFETDFQRRPDSNGVMLENGERVAFDASGIDRVEFLIEPNPGEGLKPLAKIASGGETSRLMLALKNVLAKADHVPTLIFDEIDQGIGGRVGTIVGSKLWSLSREHQVLCVTHLPQLAAHGDMHLHVEKDADRGRTTTRVTYLNGGRRIDELALMFGEISEATRQSAREILTAVAQRSQSQTIKQ